MVNVCDKLLLLALIIQKENSKGKLVQKLILFMFKVLILFKRADFDFV